MLPVERHKTAIRRQTFSRPVRTALEDGLIHQGTTVLDYGCGQGDDTRNLRELEVTCEGWDPEHRPDAELRPADIVNLGYVVNVIEDPSERADALRRAWSYARETLVVAARLNREAEDLRCPEFGDGFLTRLGTFQKFFEQSELREWIESVLGESPVAAAPGVFYVFRSEERKHAFVSTRHQRRLTVPEQ